MNQGKKRTLSIRNIILLWTLGIAGQLCWNLENQWFNLYVYEKIGKFPRIITGMIIFSSLATCFSTFFFGTLSDRKGKRKPFVCIGYIVWGICTILFGLTHLLNEIAMGPVFIGCMVVLADSIMSFFGSMGNDSGFSAWTTDLLNDKNKKMIGNAIAIQPIIGTIAGTLIGGMMIATSLGYVGFFAIMGGLVILIGILGLIFMKDAKELKPHVDGKFWQQFVKAFNFKEFFKHKELLLVHILIAVFFIAFNCFFNHIGNLFVYNYHFSVDHFGYIQGIALVLAVFVALIISATIKGEKDPFLTLLAIVFEIIGLVILIFVARISNPNQLLSLENLPLFIGVIFVGTGYILFMQTVMVWAKKLYPENQRGQFEGVRILFFVLIPMIFGSIISNVLMELFGSGKVVNPDSGALEAIPNEVLFIAAILLCLLSLIPLWRVNHFYKERIKLENEKS